MLAIIYTKAKNLPVSAAKRLNNLPDKQQGAVLFISLIILLVLSIIGINAVDRANIDAKISANFRDYNVAFQTAEKTLMEAEGFVRDNVGTLALFTDKGDNGLYSKSAADGAMWQNWKNINTQKLTSQQMTGYYVQGDPEYYIENYATIKPDSAVLNQDNYGESAALGEIEIFRVTARGVGSSADSQVILQSMYAKQM
ncbi:pilus assembly PilX family protein [Spartinivicinus poritis]|uniref:Pilus assembly protein n=1 Tax=Spartinivicinus poritis TaxID=2994640 RepID=A0ABT5UAR7_9GAMM|nr:pilus assembly protein [Spartinivicinus sp. A2-2]MDE1462553.1 pilus assembly protein [Spartinivicinus sp. A2-2]